MNAEELLADQTGSNVPSKLDVFHTPIIVSAVCDSYPSWPVHQGEWGFLENEPCRFCFQVGCIFFLIDAGPEGISGAPITRCSKCHRSWTPGGPAT
jgi:hypothetical protein